MNNNTQRVYSLAFVVRDQKGMIIDVNYETDFGSLNKVKQEIKSLFKNGIKPEQLDLRVFDGNDDDEHAMYRMTLDVTTLEDTGY